MSDIVSKWILHRLGLVVNMKPETFALKTANGRLLSEILQSYEIITEHELKLIKESDSVMDCYSNFNLINVWLERINLNVNEDDLYEIVHGVGTTSLHLFYQVFLELKDKTKLDFLTDNEINSQLKNTAHRFNIKTVYEDEDPNKINLHRQDLCQPFLSGGDVFHWYKDRIEAVQNRCRDARDDYYHNVKNKCKSFNYERNINVESGFVLSRGLSTRPSQMSEMVVCEDQPDDLDSLDTRTYEQLLLEQKQAQELLPIEPDPKEVNKIMDNLHVKKKARHENRLLRYKLHQEIMNEFDRKINDSKAMSETRVMTNIFMKQSLYEKELITKIGQVKMQKEHMVNNKFTQGEIFNKMKEKSFMESMLLKDKELNEKKLTYYVEQERMLQLHRKLWEERKRMTKKKHEDTCSKAVRDIVDIAMKISEYKTCYGTEPNKREMELIRNLFVSGQCAFDICQPVIEIIRNVDDDIEEIISRETRRQDALDSQEFDRYLNFEWPWDPQKVDCSADVFQQIQQGLNVLGYIVHRALQAKYPTVPSREKPDVPEVAVRVCLNGLNDPAVTKALKRLLSERRIEIIDLREAVNFCLDAFKVESKQEYESATSVTGGKEAKPKKEKTAQKPKKGERPNKKRKKLEEDDSIIMDPLKPMNNKSVQTPLRYPCEEIPYSLPALLGKTAQELLDEGQPLGDFLIIDMFVEYLKSLSDIQGWVLVNYPTNIQQASILEETFTGASILDTSVRNTIDTGKSLTDFLDRLKGIEDCSLYNEMVSKNVSRMLPNPIKVEPTKVYDTYLTAYIKLQKLPDDQVGDPVLPPTYEELGDEPDPLDKFYSNAGANYSFYYKEFDQATIKHLGKLILGDFSLPLKSSLELFGEGVGVDKSGPAKGVKATKKGNKVKPPRVKGPSQDDAPPAPKKDKKGKANVIIVYENKAVQVPTEDEDEEGELETAADQRASNTFTLPAVGQPGWKYNEVELPEEFLNVLATLWETAEETFIHEISQILFLNRLNMGAVMPYCNEIKSVMSKIIVRPDLKGFYLAKFQKAFNSFDMDFRKDDEFKAEMHCRIEDFKEKMAEVCDIKMMESENVRLHIINLNWPVRQLIELINNYINLMQCQNDICAQVMDFTILYYCKVLNVAPEQEDLFKREQMYKIRELDADLINGMFTQLDAPVDLTYFEDMFSVLFQKCQAYLKKVLAFNNAQVERAKVGNNQKPKSKASSPRSKASKDSKKTTDETAAKETVDKLIQEWECLLKSLSLRNNLRMELIKVNALESIREVLESLQKAFHDILKDIRSKYEQEMKNVENACRVFRQAVENETPIKKELLFVGDEFTINPEVNLFEDPPIVPDLPQEVVEAGAFTVTQLSKLADIFLDLSPSGYMPKTTFMFVLQDILWVRPDNDDWISPEMWRKVKSQAQLTEVVAALYDDLEYVYWKDFIVLNLRVDYPTERELFLLRRDLRQCDPDATELVQDYQFFTVKFWFEYEFPEEDSHKVMDIKRLLYKMYYIKNRGLNYTALLLDFCKESSPVEGFAKALELSVGKVICWDEDVGGMFKEEYVKRVREHEEDVRRRNEEWEDHYKAAYEEVCKLVDHVVHITEDVVIEDLKEDSLEDSAFKVESTESNEELNEPEQNGSEEDQKNTVRLYQEYPDNVSTDCGMTEIIFFLTVEPVITVIQAALPWHSRVKHYGDLSYWEKAVKVFEDCRNPDFNMAVLSHEFLNSEGFLELLGQTRKFTALDPVRVLKEVLTNNE